MTTTSCTLVDSARLRSGRTVVSKYRGRGIPASAIATGFPQKSLLENDIDVADPAGTQYRVEITRPTAGVTMVYEDSSFSFTGAPDGTYTGPETVWKNGAAAYDTSYSFTVGSGTVVTPAPTVTSVVVSPATATGSTQFSAVVNGANSPSQAVTWSKMGGGTLSTSGAFVAPAQTSSVQTITITATSQQDGTTQGAATITIAAAVVTPPAPTVTGVSVSPATITLAGGATQQFSKVVSGTNSPSQAGTWTATGGNVDAGGLFTAPAATSSVQVFTVTFTSAQDPSWAGHATITVPAAVVVTPPPVITPPAPVVGAPDAPTDVMVAAVAGGLRVSALAPIKTGSGPITGYTIAASSGQSLDVVSLPATITLPPLVSAYVTVTARNADGAGIASAPSPTATPGPATPGDFPAPVPAPRSRMIYM